MNTTMKSYETPVLNGSIEASERTQGTIQVPPFEAGTLRHIGSDIQ